MGIDKILVALFSVGGIALTYWFFLMRDEKIVNVASDSVDITVDGGYQPEIISVKKGKATKLIFLRKDSNACLEEVVLGDFKVRKTLPLNKKVTIEIKPEIVGEYVYSCGMGMFHGKIKVI